jgi:hypothetical protein
MIRSVSKRNHSQELIKKWESEYQKWEQSGLTQPAYCKRENLPLSQFYYWRRKIKRLKPTDNKKSSNSIIVKAGNIDFNQTQLKSSDCHMRLCFDNYCLELKDEFSSLSLNRLIKTLERL